MEATAEMQDLAPIRNISPAEQAAIEQADSITMLRDTIPTLKAEYQAAVYMLAELTKQGDVQVKKAQFMKSAGRMGKGRIGPITEGALLVIASASKGRK